MNYHLKLDSKSILDSNLESDSEYYVYEDEKEEHIQDDDKSEILNKIYDYDNRLRYILKI